MTETDTLIRAARTVALLGAALLAGLTANYAAAYGLLALGLALTWLRRRLHQPAPAAQRAATVDLIPTLTIALCGACAAVVTARQLPDLGDVVDTARTSNQAHTALLLTAIAPAALISYLLRAVWKWARISIGNENYPRPWTETIAAAAAATTSIALLALPTPAAFRDALGAGITIVLIAHITVQISNFGLRTARQLPHRTAHNRVG